MDLVLIMIVLNLPVWILNLKTFKNINRSAVTFNYIDYPVLVFQDILQISVKNIRKKYLSKLFSTLSSKIFK